MTIRFVIDEGPRYKVRNVSVIGNTKYTSDELLTDLKLGGGQYFNKAETNVDAAVLQDKYGHVGYVFAKVEPELRYLEDPGQLDLVYHITEGDRYRVGKINVVIKSDTPHTKLMVVWERLSIKPGEIADTREFRASERRLRAAQIFQNNPTQGNPPKIQLVPPGTEEQDDDSGKPKKPAGRGGGRRFGRGMGGSGGDTGQPGSVQPGPDDSLGTFRGQSPDPPPPGYDGRTAGGPPRDRELTVVVACCSPDEPGAKTYSLPSADATGGSAGGRAATPNAVPQR